jgi:striatin 1/3/4
LQPLFLQNQREGSLFCIEMDRRPIPDALQFLNRAFLEGDCERERLLADNRAMQERLTKLSLAQETHEAYECDLLRRIEMLEQALKQERNGESTGDFAELDIPTRVIARNILSQSGVQEEPLENIEDDLLDDDAFDKAIDEMSATETQPTIQRSHSLLSERVPAMIQRSHSAPSRTPPQRMASDTPQCADMIGGYRPYRVKEILRGHMDGVRTLSFHPAQPLLVSGSEDGTVKLWDLRHADRQKSSSSSDQKRSPRQVDPRLTYRGHVGAVFAARIGRSLGDSVCVSAGMDATIRVWLLSDALESDGDSSTPSSSSYSNGEGFPFSQRTLVGHTDAIWDLDAHPTSDQLLSASADGTVRVWSLSAASPLLGVLQPPSRDGGEGSGDRWATEGAVVTCVTFVRTNTSCCVAGYRIENAGEAVQGFSQEQVDDATLGYQFDVETGQAVVRFSGVSSAGINKFVSLSNMPVVAAAHCDGCVRLHDLRTGACVHTYNAAQSSARQQQRQADAIITSLCVDPAGTQLYSAGHDGILRTWSLAHSGNGQQGGLVHEQEVHPQRKWDEATHCLAFRPESSLLATGGSDALVQVLKAQLRTGDLQQ